MHYILTYVKFYAICHARHLALDRKYTHNITLTGTTVKNEWGRTEAIIVDYPDLVYLAYLNIVLRSQQ
jgi:hypothetical protein